jgi:formylglycine-generating enzyme required for sulfatase activity
LGNTFRVDVNADDDATLEAGIAINAAGITGNAAFPTGQALWCMKYELSQGGYRDFLNSLNLAQQTSRTTNPPTSAIGTGALSTGNIFRNFIEIATPSAGGTTAVFGLDASGNNIFNEVNDGEWVVCNFLSWMDAAAYLDWSGLAPMSEIVYERICRGASTAGANPSILGEFAWGTTTIFPTNYNVTTLNTATEAVSNASATVGNANLTSTVPIDVFGPIGPLRNGIFATASSSRVTSGAAFYGVMEMTGNLYEICVSLGSVAGRGFTGINGNGILSVLGNANTANWPCGIFSTVPPSCSEVISSAGIRARGASWSGLVSTAVARVSYRTDITNTSTRSSEVGCRGVLYIN